MASQKYRLNEYRVEPVPWIDILTKLLIRERRSVLFVGEGDFSFTVAFAAVREHGRLGQTGAPNPGTWDGIISTRYEPNDENMSKPPPVFPCVVSSCICDCQIHCQMHCQLHRYSPQRFYTITSERIQVLQRLKNANDLVWICGIDATAIPPELTVNSSVIWFQCPWLPGPSIYPLIHDFLMRTSETITAGVYVCIGITSHPDYVERYELPKILGYAGSSSVTDVMKTYWFCGADDTLIESILSFGYHHQGLKDIHDYIRHNHVTLVFCKLSM